MVLSPCETFLLSAAASFALICTVTYITDLLTRKR